MATRQVTSQLEVRNGFVEFALPSGVEPPVAPAGKARLYYKPSTAELMLSVSGGAYGVVEASGASGDTLTLGGDVVLSRSAADTLSITESVVVTSPAASAAPLTVNAHASQSGDVVLVQASDGTDWLKVNSAGDLAHGTDPITTFTRNSHTSRLGLGTAAPGNDTPIHWVSGFGANTNWPVRLTTIYDGSDVEHYLMFNGTLTGTKATPTLTASAGGAGFVRHVAGGGGASSRLVLGATTTGAGQSAAGSLFVWRTGRVGVGTAAAPPDAKLHVDGTADELQLLVQGNATQTAKLVSVQAAGTTEYFSVSGAGYSLFSAGVAINGDNGAGSNPNNAMLYCVASAATHTPIVARRAASHTANLQEWQDESGAELSWIGPGGRVFMQVPNSAPADGDLSNATASFYLNQAGNTLTVKAKYSDGTVKTGSIALT